MKDFTLDIERKWGAQRTTMTVYHQGEDPNVLKISTPLTDVMESVKEEFDAAGFMETVKEDIGSVTFVLTQKTFAERFDAAAMKADFNKRFDDAVAKALKEIGKATKQYAGNISG